MSYRLTVAFYGDSQHSCLAMYIVPMPIGQERAYWVRKSDDRMKFTDSRAKYHDIADWLNGVLVYWRFLIQLEVSGIADWL